MSVYGLDLGHATTVEAEHWLADLPSVPGLVACTHLVHHGRRRVVITLAAPAGLDTVGLPYRADQPTGEDGATRTAADDHAAGRAGRAVIYPGVERLVGVLSVADLLAASAIGRVKLIGGVDPTVAPDTLIDTRDFVRPQWMDGELTLVATPAPAGRIAPFEVPNPTPCCGGSH
ncbi:hypothetical protein [Rugosimonospora africana]|uniref:Uncharacterized protein n=1 Tax=Rugosimonospora africana TaxID=556532 RepID=A0A8J3QZE5_9ACTN|nr:hypothetical protein [Rugosimonospora africana]GIH17421.1 hypothetical protein Raf01_55930 [Rugosimonospora africana]